MRTASFNRGGAFVGNRAFAGNRIARADFGRPGWGWAGNRPGWGWAGGGWGGNRWGWGGGWGGWGWGAAALGTGLAYAASSSYCDPYYDYYGNCGYGYGSNYGYASYAPAFGFGTYRPFARAAWRARWW